VGSLSDRLLEMAEGFEGTLGLVVKDLKDGDEVTYQDHLKFGAASVIKVPILWELLRQVEVGAVSLEERLAVPGSAKVGGTGILKELHDGIELTVQDLATLMIVVSDNTATNLIIDRLGMDRINATIKEIGLRDSSLKRKMMDFEAKKMGKDNIVSARDMALILEHMALGRLLRRDLCEQAINIMLRQQMNNKLPRGLLLCPNCKRAVKDYPQCPWCYLDLRKNPPSGARLAHKTGELAGVEHDVGVLLLPDRAVVIVVLTSDLKDNEIGIRFIGDVAAEVARYYAA